ncbi:alpha-1,2-mannosidase, putative [Salegentibacter holothuriorum]|uniref:Alpha-1,2-mannosidase, putative n=1 Tax=Salegentibacter holothuriorum TaxID=241145 RepID=A0A1T5BF17_9FLAO|nr:GH92 family glycosyl hydrolase [Salegentibacter holothuriorum]SKB45901.1 alpha-1,2-mannosidase, putative [Salegentibacter holothuriorum]
MKNLGLFLLMLFTVSVFAQKQRLTEYVNPFIGTDGPGNTYPGATVPYGMLQLSPDNGIGGWDRISGYFYQDSIISGFSHMHLSGTGAGDLYDILVMPTNSRFSKRIPENNNKPFSNFSHEQEEASPGYYSVQLLDYDIKAELTTTKRTGIQRYTFPEDSRSQIHVDLGYALNWDRPTETHIKVVNDSVIEGYRKSTGWANDQRVYFVMKFSKPFKDFELFEAGKKVSEKQITAADTKIILNYKTTSGEQIILKTGVSSANIKGAYASLQTEAPHFNFDSYRAEADEVWQHELEKIKIKTVNKDQKAVFYTMMYQSMLAPTLLSDPNGNYKGANGEVEKAKDFERYDTFSLWDTFRAAHPLYTIIQQEKVPDFIKSMLAHYKETGLLPVWSMQGNETNMMLGYHAVPVVVDAYFKGFEFDADLAYKACKASAMANDREIDVYRELGYVPAGEENEDWSVSKTLEYAYDDWCIAMFAKDLGKTADYEYFLERSQNWKNIYDEQSTFFRPKTANGEFVENFIPKEYTKYFSESNAWQYFWFVPQDIPELVKEVGGEQRFEQKLDSMFAYHPLATDKLPIFSTGMIGQYAHGNEPSHHVAYLYNYLNNPSETQKLVREILTTQYKNEPAGHCGNEDCGQMSSWYIFSSLGFYPVNPAQGTYILGAPLFENAEISLPEGNIFSIKTKDFSPNNIYVKSVHLNGKKLDRAYITHKEIVSGGELIFKMTNKPEKQKPGNIQIKTPKPNKIYK